MICVSHVQSVFDLNDFKDGSSLEFRRATENMKWASYAIEKLSQKLENPEVLKSDRLAVISATGHGELDATIDFLVNRGLHNRAKPIVFQNSLHNSTLGFISLKYQMLGPGFTISNGCESIERSIDLAHTLLLSGTADFVLVIGGDLIDPKFSEEIRVTYPQSVEQVSFYGAALFGTKDSLAKAGLPATPIELKTESTDQVMNRPFNGSLILDRIREAVEKQESEFELIRPDSSKTKVHLQLG